MLQMIRERSQGLIVGVIVFFIALTFALFGIEQYLGGQSSVVVADVNGEEIELTDFQRAFQQLRQRAQAMFGEDFDPDLWSGDEAKLSALDYVVNERLLLQVADKANIRASDSQVADYIRTSPQFQNDGNFSPESYRQMIRAIGFSELGFESQVRKDLVINQLRAGIAATAFATAEELQRVAQLRQQTRDVGYAILGIEQFREGISPARDEIEKYYSANAEKYRIPEKLSVSYVELSIDALMADVKVDDAQLRAYYDANKANYTTEEQRNVNHILIQLPRDASADEEAAALEKAKTLRAKALDAASFEDVARENSDDIGSRTDGGETGFFGRGVMAPEFEKAVFSMAQGELSEPVRTDFGYHIIRVKEIKPGGVKSFEEARDDVSSALRREQAETLYFELAERLSELAYEQPDSLEPAADALNLTVQTTAGLTRGELSELFSPAVVEAAFDPEVLVEGLNSEPIDVSNGRIAVVRANEHVPSRVPPLEQVLSTVTADVIDARAREAVTQRGEAIVERLNAGEEPAVVMSEAALEWNEEKSVNRDTAKLSRVVSRAAFRADPPPAGKVAYSGVEVGTGDYAIIGVSNVSVPPIEQLNISEISDLRREIAAERTAASWQDFTALLKASADIETYPSRL